MDVDVVFYVEDWVSEADMRRRVRSMHFTSLLAVVESAKDPRVRFDFVTLTRGLDYVAEVRNEVLTDPALARTRTNER
jgi:hypothetical protein